MNSFNAISVKQGTKYLVLFIVLLSVFSNPLSYLFGINMNLLDEGVLFISLVVFASYFIKRINVKIIYFLIFFFLIYSVIVSLLFGLNKDFWDILLQSLVTLKFFIITLALFLFLKDDISLIKKTYNILLRFLIFGFFLNIAMGDDLNQFLGMEVFSRPNMSSIRYGGFVAPNHLAYFMVLSIGLVLNQAFFRHQKLIEKDWIKIGFYFVIILLTDSRSALIGVILFFVFFYKNLILRKAKTLLYFLTLFVVSIIMLIVFTDIVESVSRNISDSFSLDNYYIRGIIFNMAIQISYIHFPIGTGAATFASVFSDGSLVYENFGVSNRSFFIDKTGIYDSSFASWLGEYGIVGLVFLSLIFFYLRNYLAPKNSRVMVNSLLMVFVFFSLTSPVFTNNAYIFLSFPIFYLFSFRLKSNSY